MPKIFQVNGKANSGKTTSIKLVAEIFCKRKSVSLIASFKYKAEILNVYAYFDVLVVIFSKGDDDKAFIHLQSVLKWIKNPNTEKLKVNHYSSQFIADMSVYLESHINVRIEVVILATRQRRDSKYNQEFLSSMFEVPSSEITTIEKKSNIGEDNVFASHLEGEIVNAITNFREN